MVPAITLLRPRARDPLPGPGRPRPPDRVPRRRTSGRSSTSDGPARPGRAVTGRLGGLVRLTHPFPSLLDGVVVAAVALLAGGDAATAAPARRSRWPPSRPRSGRSTTSSTRRATPVTSRASRSRPGSSRRASPRVVVVVAAAVGLAARGRRPGPATRRPGRRRSWRSAMATTCGAKGTAWSWLPFAVGIPLLPVFGWLGATGTLPAAFAILSRRRSSPAPRWPSPTRAPTSSATSAAGRRFGRDPLGLATGLGRRAALLGAVVVAAIATLAGGRTPPAGRRGRGAGAWLVIGLGIAVGRDGGAARRERAWELEAVGVGAAGRRVAGRARRRRVAAPPSGLSSRRRRSGPARSRSRAGAWRSSGTSPGWPDRSRRSTPRNSALPQDADQLSTASARPCLALTSESSEIGRAAPRPSVHSAVGVGLGDAGRPRRRPRPRRRRRRPPRSASAGRGRGRPSILSRSLIRVSSPRATCSASRRRFFGSSTFISS